MAPLSPSAYQWFSLRNKVTCLCVGFLVTRDDHESQNDDRKYVCMRGQGKEGSNKMNYKTFCRFRETIVKVRLRFACRLRYTNTFPQLVRSYIIKTSPDGVRKTQLNKCISHSAPTWSCPKTPKKFVT